MDRGTLCNAHDSCRKRKILTRINDSTAIATANVWQGNCRMTSLETFPSTCSEGAPPRAGRATHDRRQAQG